MLRGHGPAVIASGECTRIMYAGRTEYPRSKRRGRPTNRVSDCLPPSWTAGPREELLPRIPDIFSWRFFSNLQQEHTRLCDSISSTKSSSAILTPDSRSPPRIYPDLKVSDRSEHFFKPGDISVPSPLFAFLRIRRLISTNLVETPALRTNFSIFSQSIIILAKDGGLKFSKTGGGEGKSPPPKKKKKKNGFSSEPTGERPQSAA